MNLVPCQAHSKSEPYHLIDPQRAGLSWETVVKYRRFIFLWRQTYFSSPEPVRIIQSPVTAKQSKTPILLSHLVSAQHRIHPLSARQSDGLRSSLLLKRPRKVRLG